MSARVSVTVGADGVLAVKTATTPAELADLDSEAGRLRQAAHPGVVRLVEHRIANDSATLFTLYAGESVTVWRGTVPQAAGLLAAVATTVADLHDVGLVHGRLDETHVLIGADRRPRLCGFSPPPDEANPSDDVAALGRLFAALLDRATAADRRGAFRWPRAQVAERRALAQLIADATDPMVERRPTARALARSILATMPHAELAPAGAGPGIIGEAAPAPTGHFEVRVPRHVARPGRRRPAEPKAEVEPGAKAEVEVDAKVEGEGQGADDVDAVFGDQTTAEFDDLFVDRPWSENEDDRPDLTGRPRLQRPAPSRSPNAFRRGLTLLAVLLVVAVAGLSVRRSGHDDAGAPGSPASTSRTQRRSCAPAPPPSADVDGDGCGESVQVADGVVNVDGVAFSVGDPDDAVAIGDWDCDGQATPAAYRPSTGDVFVFTDWAADGQPSTVEAIAQVAGGRTLVVAPSTTSGSARCDTLAVELAAGGRHVVEVAP